MKKYFRIRNSIVGTDISARDDAELFPIKADSLGRIIDTRREAVFLKGWIRVALVPHHEVYVLFSDLISAVEWLPFDTYQDMVTNAKIIEPTWLDQGLHQFELVRSLAVNQWIRNDINEPATLAHAVLRVGTVGRVLQLSWDFEGSDDRQYWMMEIETADGQQYDVMYPDLLKAARPYNR